MERLNSNLEDSGGPSLGMLNSFWERRLLGGVVGYRLPVSSGKMDFISLHLCWGGKASQSHPSSCKESQQTHSLAKLDFSRITFWPVISLSISGDSHQGKPQNNTGEVQWIDSYWVMPRAQIEVMSHVVSGKILKLCD